MSRLGQVTAIMVRFSRSTLHVFLFYTIIAVILRSAWPAINNPSSVVTWRGNSMPSYQTRVLRVGRQLLASPMSIQVSVCLQISYDENILKCIHKSAFTQIEV